MTVAPSSIDELQRTLSDSAGRPVRVVGGGSKRRSSPPRELGSADGAFELDVRQLTGVATYDPAECVVTARGGTPVAAIAAMLTAHGQYLPWDPPLVDNGSTLGGMTAAGWNGPGRYRYGGVRDFVIGAKVVDGRGRLITSGGQVVKNAAGFLLHHAMVGSAGRLGVLVEVSFKVFPRPEATCTLALRAATLDEAVSAHERVRRAVHDIDALDLTAEATTVLVRIAGAAAAVPARADRVVRVLGPGAVVAVDAEERRLWADAVVVPTGDVSVLKVPTAPSRLAQDLAVLRPLGQCRVSAGGAVIYASNDFTPEGADATLQRAGLTAVGVAGPLTGARLGEGRGAHAFADRVASVLDPDGRFY